jgi:hypothetical protein
MAKLTELTKRDFPLVEVLEELLKQTVPPPCNSEPTILEQEKLSTPPAPAPTPACVSWMHSTATPYATTMADILECIAAVKGTTWDALMLLSWLPSACYDAYLVRERDRERGEALLAELLHLERGCRFLSMKGEVGEPRGVFIISSQESMDKKEDEVNEPDKTTECVIKEPRKEWCQLELL